MLKIREYEFDFDISAPGDLEKYLHSCEVMAEKEKLAPKMPTDVQDPQYMQDYYKWLSAYCTILTDWIDDILGDGACNKLLGPKTSLSGLMNVYDEISEAATAQGNAIGQNIRKYMPNRATRRKVKVQK